MSLPDASKLVTYKNGYDIKPKGVNNFGTVIFTNGIADCFANQETCEAYGYYYDITRGACMAFKPQDDSLVSADDTNVGNTKSGIRNEVKPGAELNTMSGSGNVVEEMASANLVTGKQNKITKNISSGLLSGDRGYLLRQGEVMAGGGSYISNVALADPEGYAQRSVIQLTGRTYDNSNIYLTCNGKNNALITLQPNTIIGYKVVFTTLDQTTGNYTHYEQKGVITVRANKSVIICSNENNIICQSPEIEWNYFTWLQTNSGGETPVYNDLEMRVQGVTGVNYLHHGVMTLQETRTTTNI